MKLELIQAFTLLPFSFHLVTCKNDTTVCGRIVPIFELARDCENEDLIKNEGARVLTRLNVFFSDAQGQLTPKSAMEFRLNLNYRNVQILVIIVKFSVCLYIY